MSAIANDWVGLELAGGRYHVTAKLGEGGMGLVYRARDHNLDRDVIIKVPRRALLEHEHFTERFAREIRSLVRLAHPHIVKAIEVGERDGVPFAVMQYLGDPVTGGYKLRRNERRLF
jgi:serine/threonine-protein kinase